VLQCQQGQQHVNREQSKAPSTALNTRSNWTKSWATCSSWHCLELGGWARWSWELLFDSAILRRFDIF